MRVYKPKQKKAVGPRTPPDLMKRAVDHYLTTIDGTRTKIFYIPRSTLVNKVLKLKKLPEDKRNSDSIHYGYSSHKRVFSNEQERLLVKYLTRASAIYFGLTPLDVRVLAYQCAKSFNIRMPPSWAEKNVQFL